MSAYILSGCTSNITNRLLTQNSVSTNILQLDGSSITEEDLTASVVLNNGSTTLTGEGIKLDEGDVIIEQSGTYCFSGTLAGGRIKVEAEGADVVIILNGVTISNGVKDAIYAEDANSVTIYAADHTENTLISGKEGDSTSDLSDEDNLKNSQKAVIMAKCPLTLKGSGAINIYGYINNGIQSKEDLSIQGVTININAVNDGIKSNSKLIVDSGNITISKSVEGLEGCCIEINGGDIVITSSDDGINAADDVNDPDITINGGNIYVNSEGDGIDSNKNITINGGTVYVDGPSNSGNAAIDIASETGGIFAVNGGTVLSLGMSGMLENTDESSTQQTLSYVFSEKLEKGSEITITDSQSNIIATFTTKKNADSITYSSSELKSGETYTFTSGELSGTLTADTINATNHTGHSGPGGMPHEGSGPNKGGDMSEPPEDFDPDKDNHKGEPPEDFNSNSSGSDFKDGSPSDT